MTLEKAIETHASMQEVLSSLLPPDEKTALKLGKEALSRLRTLRAEPHLQAAALLPSETEF